MKGKDGIMECHVCRNRSCAPYDEPCRSCRRTRDGSMKYFYPIDGYKEEKDMNRGLRDCRACLYMERDEDIEPCRSCHKTKVNHMSNFEPMSGAPKQPTVPPMPEVIPSKGGGAEQPSAAKMSESTPIKGGDRDKFDFAEMIADIQGEKELEKVHILNALCYILRYEDKGDIGDINKAVWNLDKLAELKEDKDNG